MLSIAGRAEQWLAGDAGRSLPAVTAPISQLEREARVTGHDRGPSPVARCNACGTFPDSRRGAATCGVSIRGGHRGAGFGGDGQGEGGIIGTRVAGWGRLFPPAPSPSPSPSLHPTLAPSPPLPPHIPPLISLPSPVDSWLDLYSARRVMGRGPTRGCLGAGGSARDPCGSHI